MTGRAVGQFNDIMDNEVIYDAFMRKVLWLMDAPWDAWPVYPGGDEPEFREAQFGEHGLVSFRVDDNAEILVIFNILWAG
jgi:hypothetical protein